MEVAGAAPTQSSNGGQGGAPAGNTAAPAVNTGTTASSSGTDWTANFSPELKEYATTKGFKDPSAVVDSYRNFEKLMGAPKDRILKLPEKDDASPEWDEISSRLGWPGKPEDYGLQTPKEGGDEDFTKAMAKTLHDARVPRRQAQAIVKGYSDYATAKQAQVTAQQEQVRGQQTQELQKEWGQAFNQNVEIGKRAVQAFGFDRETVDKLETSLGFAGVMKMMHTIGSKIGEDKFISGHHNNQSFGGVLTPDQAQARIQIAKQDKELMSRYIKGDRAVVEEMKMLHQMAYPDVQG